MDTAESGDLTFEIVDAEGQTEEISLPAPLVAALGDGDSPVATVADITTMAFTSRAHHLVHHGGDETDADLQTAEDRMLELFEDRFGVSYAEATGHSH